MLKGFVVGAAVVVGLAALADRAVAAAAGSAVAGEVQQQERMSEEPEVTFRGFPFVTQALRGEFSEIDVEARDVRVEDITFSRIEADLRGVRVGLRDALAGEVEAVPVESGTAVVTLDYADLNAHLDARPGSPRASGTADGQLVVRSSVDVAGGGRVDVQGTGTARVTDRGITVTVTGVRTVGGTVPAALLASAAGRLSFTISTAGLPFGISVVDVEVGASALRLAATARGVVIRTG